MVTGCPLSALRDPLLAEAGSCVVEAQGGSRAHALLCRALSLPQSLSTTTGWRQIGRAVLEEAGATTVKVVC